MADRGLRSQARFLVVLGWLLVALGTLAGFAPWFVFGQHPAPPDASWMSWAVYAGPAIGLLVGALAGLVCFVVSGAVRTLLDQWDLLEDILQTQRRLLEFREHRQHAVNSETLDPFDLTEIKDTEEPRL